MNWVGHDNATAARRAADVPRRRSEQSPGLSDELRRRIGEGLQLLRRAYLYADDVAADTWEFALEIRELRSAGLTNVDLRWLVHRGFVDHARDVSLPGDAERAFHRGPTASFTRRSCFVLTPQGADFVAQLAIDDRPGLRQFDENPPAAESSVPRVVPKWDRDLQELSFNGLLIKQFKVPAPNQEMVLATFEEDGWPTRIDDPLPPQADQDPKRRLHDTIVSLNRNHKHALIRFVGDGSGQGVRWTRVSHDPETHET